jgi:AraC family transcriptional regulator
MGDEFIKLNIAAHTWAIFPTGEHAANEITSFLQTTWQRIFPEWFPGSGYEHAPDAPEFEIYYKTGTDKFIAEVWIPVIKS